MSYHLPKLHSDKTASLLIRVGLAFVFIYAAASAFKTPEAWLSYIPTFTNKFIHPKTALDIISVLQFILAGWLVWGKYLKISALIAAALLGGIVFTNYTSILITFRDVGLVFAAVALIFLDHEQL